MQQLQIHWLARRWLLAHSVALQLLVVQLVFINSVIQCRDIVPCQVWISDLQCTKKQVSDFAKNQSSKKAPVPLQRAVWVVANNQCRRPLINQLLLILIEPTSVAARHCITGVSLSILWSQRVCINHVIMEQICFRT